MGDEARSKNAPPLQMVLPEKFVASSPDINLRRAVLERAIRDIIDYNQSKRCAEAASKRQAWNWIRSNTRTDKWFTFLDVCEDLDLDPDFIRKKVFANIASPEFVACFEKVPGNNVTSLPKRVPRRVVQYRRKDKPERGPTYWQKALASALETNDQLLSESTPSAEEKSR